MLTINQDEALKVGSYYLRVEQDAFIENPRTEDTSCLLTTMACWHSRYALGDGIKDSTPEEFWQRLVRENVSNEDLVAAAKSGKLAGIRVEQNKKNPENIDIYEKYELKTVFGSSDDDKEVLEWEDLPQHTVSNYLIDELTVNHCMILLEPHAEWMPLWLYDHSGISMSCGKRTGQYADRWDSGCVGWIICLKKTLLENEIISNDQPDAEWRARAEEVMKGDVKIYDHYIGNEVYAFFLYDEDGEEIESVGGFFGFDILENGILDVASDFCDISFRKEVESGNYEVIRASKIVTESWNFED